MWIAAHAPERVARLVVCASSPRFPDPSIWRERIAAVEASGSVEPIADATVERWLTPAFAAAHPELRARLRAMLVATNPAGYAACCQAIQAMDLRPALGAIAAPTLVIAGAEDPATPPPQHAEVIAGAIPSARYEVLSPAAHLLNLEQADRVSELILEHVT
jgi:3-oxoadipate enol-lactonase